MNHKPLFLTAVLIVLLAIAGAFWYMQQRQVAVNQPVVTDPVGEASAQVEPETSVDTSDWKTYRNEEYGFEMKYPKEYAYFVPNEIFEGTKLKNSSFRVSGGGHFEYDVWKNLSGLTAAELLDQTYQEYSGGWGGSLVTIHRSVGAYFRGLKDDGTCLIEINLFPDIKAFHVIRIEMCDVEGRSEKMKTFHSILSTVQY
jgi:hypothetical protein